MNVAGIIAEYNPFHNGHLYHLTEAKKAANADYLIVVMSGNFTQRGIPALISKYERTKHALLAGADLVLELPMPYAISSAEYFALGSCALFRKLGVVNSLCFGMEQCDLETLSALAHIISDEPPKYQELLKQLLSTGLSFPKAQQEALSAYLPGLDCSLLSTPNNRLGLEYLKALKKLDSSIHPFPIKRIGKGYDDTELSTDGLSEFSSASAIRNSVISSHDLSTIANHVPEFVWSDLESLLNDKKFLLSKDLDLLLHYKLLQQDANTLQTYMDVNEDLANKILNHLPSYTGFDDFCLSLKSKDLTYTRISRLLLHILLDLKKRDMKLLEELQHAPYGRILGFRKDSAALLHAIKENSSLPLISKLADASKILSPEAFQILEKEITSAHIYEAILSQKAGCAPVNEYTQPIILL